MGYELVGYEVADGVATVTLNNPEKRNMLSGQMLAEQGASFGTPEINVGAFPYMIMAIIYRNVPRKRVNEMMLLGERLSAEQALEYGLANKVVPAGEIDAAVA